MTKSGERIRTDSAKLSSTAWVWSTRVVFHYFPSPEQVIAEGAPDSPNSILPRDLLALGVGAAVIRDGDLIHAPASLGHLGRHLWLEPEPVLLELDLLQDFPSKSLVARPDVGKIQVRKYIRERR